MKRTYKSLNRTFGVINYEIPDPSNIILQFKSGKFRYIYNSVAPGQIHVANMADLARNGMGLSTYVNQHVRENYAAKLPL